MVIAQLGRQFGLQVVAAGVAGCRKARLNLLLNLGNIVLHPHLLIGLGGGMSLGRGIGRRGGCSECCSSFLGLEVGVRHLHRCIRRRQPTIFGRLSRRHPARRIGTFGLAGGLLRNRLPRTQLRAQR